MNAVVVSMWDKFVQGLYSVLERELKIRLHTLALSCIPFVAGQPVPLSANCFFYETERHSPLYVGGTVTGGCNCWSWSCCCCCSYCCWSGCCLLAFFVRCGSHKAQLSSRQSGCRSGRLRRLMSMGEWFRGKKDG